MKCNKGEPTLNTVGQTRLVLPKSGRAASRPCQTMHEVNTIETSSAMVGMS